MTGPGPGPALVIVASRVWHAARVNDAVVLLTGLSRVPGLFDLNPAGQILAADSAEERGVVCGHVAADHPRLPGHRCYLGQ